MVSVTMDRRLGLKPKRNETVVASLLLVISSVQLVLAVPALAAILAQAVEFATTDPKARGVEKAGVPSHSVPL